MLAQLTEFLPRRVFDRFVKEYGGNRYVRSFTCWNQMLCMVFWQLTSRESLRDLMLSLEAHRPKYYHLGFGTTVSRRNLGTANEKRSYKICGRLRAYRRGEEKLLPGRFRDRSRGQRLCPWLDHGRPLSQRVLGGGVPKDEVRDKPPHTLRRNDLSTQLRARFLCEPARRQRTEHSTSRDRKFLFHGQGVYRLYGTVRHSPAKGLFSYTGQGGPALQEDVLPTCRKGQRRQVRPVGQARRPLSKKRLPRKTPPDQISGRRDRKGIRLPDQQYRSGCHGNSAPAQVTIGGRTVLQMDEAAPEDQILWGTSMNVIQIHTHYAIIAYCLVAIFGNKLKSERRIYGILQILNISLLDKTPVREILTGYDIQRCQRTKR